jgi:hypothetical protein
MSNLTLMLSWYWGPLAVVILAPILYLLTGLRSRHEERRDRELDRWCALMTPTVRAHQGYRPIKEVQDEPAGPKPAGNLPGALRRMLPEIGGGVPVRHFELVDGLAYVAIMGPSITCGSEYQAVIAKLDKPAPRMVVQPLPVIDGARVPSTGVQFKKDVEFMQLFHVEGAGSNAKDIVKWLRRSLRDALREIPEAWLYVQGKAIALVAYGAVDAEKLESLVVAADAIFAEHGAEGGPSLLFDADAEEGGHDEDDDEAAQEPVKPKDAKADPRAKGTAARKA